MPGEVRPVPDTVHAAAARRPIFNVIYADPPWLYTKWSDGPQQAPPGKAKPAGQRVRPVPYPCMPTKDICALPVQQLADRDCVLFLWAIYPKLPDAFEVIRAWGFVYKTVAFTWTKLNPSGRGFAYGLGYWTRSNPELCLLATRGHPRRVSKAVPNLLVSPRREHSRKPDEVRERIVQLCGDLPRAELFARQKVPGWSAWGNEVASDFTLAATLPEGAADKNALGTGAEGIEKALS